MDNQSYIFHAPGLIVKHWVYFNIDTGEVVSISNEKQDNTDLSSIEVSYEEVSALISGEERFDTCIVDFDPKLKTYVLKRRTIEDPVYDVDDLIYCVSETDDADITVVQDLKNTCWKFLISEKLRSQIADKAVSIKTNLSFSITQENNPNILYRTLSFPFNDLVQNFYVIKDFKEDYEFDGKPVSVYTIRRFDSYSFEVINE